MARGLVEDFEQARRRRINENRLELFGGNAERTIAFICECSDAYCRETVVLTPSQFEERVAVKGTVVHPRHEPV